MYTGPILLDLLARKHQQPNTSGLYKQDTFTLDWRAKVGSFPHPNIETLISAGEPCGAWKISEGGPEDKQNVGQDRRQNRPEDKRQVGENLKLLPVLPLNGYIPGSSIRGVVRAWAEKRPELRNRMYEFLGNQVNDRVTSGKIEFLDAWPQKACKLTLDIVNPQQDFQVFHREQGKPVSSYTLGNGSDNIEITVAIRGTPGKATPEEVEEVWGWVEQALGLYGVGSRTASGYGSFRSSTDLEPEPDYDAKIFSFTLYNQGCAGPDMREMELRPSHWRGWLRSWLLRFFLGVMNESDTKKTVNELLGTLEDESSDTLKSKSKKGLIRLQIIKGKIWGDESDNKPVFYSWKGTLKISAPKDILNNIILPVIKFAVSLGGVGRGWRRPLHIFTTPAGKRWARGTYLILQHTVKNKESGKDENKLFTLAMNHKKWEEAYNIWFQNIDNKWSDRINLTVNRTLPAEVFSPSTCAVYLVPGATKEPFDLTGESWIVNEPTKTRGRGMEVIYQDTYKRRKDVGGIAAGGEPYCSWASIKIITFPNQAQNTKCSEIVCIFMGGNNALRRRFRDDISNIDGAIKLFGN